MDSVYLKFSTCKSTGRPIHTHKVFFSLISAEFNEHLQVKYLFIRELGNFPGVHMVDRATGYLENSLVLSQTMKDALRMINKKWFKN